jgi:hypothetical protein
MKTSDDLQLLRELRNDGKLIPFVGAGLSKRFGLPSWSDLIGTIAKELGYDPDVFNCNGTNEQLAEYYVATKGSIGPLRSLMDQAFNPGDDKISNSKAHSALVEMNLQLIYTTNYDKIIERAFKLKKRDCYTVANIDDIATAPIGATRVVKFHGTFSDDESLVLTECSYFNRLDFESATDIQLRADTLGHSLLFIGYSLNDLNIRYLLFKLHKLRDQVKRSGTRMPSAFLATFGAGDIQRTLLSRWDVSTIELDPINKTRSVDEFLEALL